ncbi:MAG: hypothetical protein LQ349_007059 [Xanthoria aureola]|nr:MAG: hypothetical protein LQ349_007059 [Xanthoria aureola]
MVTVLAGPSRVPYHVHHDVLCARSAHCQIALEGPFAEAQSGEMTFPEEDPDTIKLFLHWVYHLALPRCHYPVDLQTYISLMSFAHSILLEELQNTCMDSIRAAFREQSQGRETRTVGGEELAMAYETTAELPKLRFFVCFQAALQRTLNRSAADVGGWMDEELTNLLQQGGDLAVQLPKLLVYCTGLIPFPSANWAENERYSHYGMSRARALSKFTMMV